MRILLCGLFSFKSFDSSFSCFTSSFFFELSTPEYNCNKLVAFDKPLLFLFLSNFFFFSLGDKNLEWSEGDAICWGNKVGVALTCILGDSKVNECNSIE